MSPGLGLSGERQDSCRAGEHTVRVGSKDVLCGNMLFLYCVSVQEDINRNGFVYILCASVRTLCDNLRRERDRAVSDLADALRNLDDMRKQKNDVARELKELK